MRTRHPAENQRTSTPPPVVAASLVPPQATEPETGPPAERWSCSVDKAARLTGLSRDLLHDEMRRGHLDYLKVGRGPRNTRQHLEQFLGITPTPQPSPAGTTVGDPKAGNGAP